MVMFYFINTPHIEHFSDTMFCLFQVLPLESIPTDFSTLVVQILQGLQTLIQSPAMSAIKQPQMVLDKVSPFSGLPHLPIL